MQRTAIATALLATLPIALAANLAPVHAKLVMPVDGASFAEPVPYTTDATERAAMIETGWVAEGYGEQGVAMCVPR